MTADVHSFNRNITQFANFIGILPEQAVKKIALDLYVRITRKTPVLTGRARASWNIGIGQPDTTVPPVGVYGDQGPSKTNVLAQVDSRLPVVWITSNLPYITELENGHSQKAPAGMVKISIAEEQAKFAEIVREITG